MLTIWTQLFYFFDVCVRDNFFWFVAYLFTDFIVTFDEQILMLINPICYSFLYWKIF